MKRVFVFSCHGKETHQTGFNRLMSISESLAKTHEVHFIYGNKEGNKQPIQIKGNLIEIPLSYSSGLFHHFYKNLLANGKRRRAKLLLLIHYLFTRKEIFDLKSEFDTYKKNTNTILTENDIVFVSFPSVTVHNLGYSLKKEFGSKLILDYRDPGVFGYQLIEENKIMFMLRRFFLKRNELRNMKSADQILTISESIRKLFPQRYCDEIEIIRNGYDIRKINFDLIRNHSTTFKLVYLGSIYSDQLADLTFFKALREFIDQNGIPPHKFQIRFIGAGEAPRLKEVLKTFKLEPYSYISPKMAIEKIYDELYCATMFFHLKYGNRKEIITTKQYEYLAFQKPILLPITDDGDLANSIIDNKAGFVCNTKQEVIDTLKSSYDGFLNKEYFKVERTAQELYAYSRQSQEDKLAKLIATL